jgi:hypothetical protein
MYERTLRGYEEAFGHTQTSTLATVNNLCNLHGKLNEAEQMFKWKLKLYERKFEN